MAIFSRAPSLIPRGGSVLGVSFNMPGIPAGISTDYFFDRAAVRNALKPAVHKALVRGGLAVMQIARRSIKRQGMAQPELKVMKTYAGLSLKQIAGLESATAERQGVMRDSRGRYLRGSGAIRSRDGQITEADRRKVLERIRQIRSKDASPAGSPPNKAAGQVRPVDRHRHRRNVRLPATAVHAAGHRPGHRLRPHRQGVRQPIQGRRHLTTRAHQPAHVD